MPSRGRAKGLPSVRGTRNLRPLRPPRPLTALLPLAAAALLSAACASREPIPIGLAGPFADPVGEPMRAAARLAVQEINAAGGIDGRPLELVERDDRGDADSAVSVAADLYRSRVVAVIGHLYSSQTLAAAPVYNGGTNPVVALSPSSSAPQVADAGPWTFRLCPSDDAHGAALARWIRQRLDLARGAVLYLNDDYGRGIRVTFEREFTRLGGTVVSSDPYLTDPLEVDAYLDRLVAQGTAQFLVIAGNGAEGRTILAGLRARGSAIPVLGGDGLEGIEAAGPTADGVFYTTAYLVSEPSERNRRFVEAYRRAAGGAPPNQPAAAAYDAVYLLRDVIARGGAKRDQVRRTLAEVGTGSRPFPGVTGPILFDANGDVPAGLVSMGVVRGGRLLPAADR